MLFALNDSLQQPTLSSKDPTLSSKDGNVIIEVADGKQIGYKIGTGKMVSLGDVIPNLQDFTATSGSAMVRSFADIMVRTIAQRCFLC